MKIRSALIAGTVTTLALVGGIASAANARGNDGIADRDEVLFYYSPNFQNSRWDWDTHTSNFAAGGIYWLPFTYLTDGAGKDQIVRNNAASVKNTRDQQARVYFRANYQGVSDYIGPGRSRNLSPALRNDNASFRWE